MTTYYVEREFLGRKVAVIDAGSEEEALSIARNSEGETGVPFAGLKLDRHTCRWTEPRIVESGSVELRRKLKELAGSISGGIITGEQETPVERARTASALATYYFVVPFDGHAVLRIVAEGEEQAQHEAASVAINLGANGIKEPVINYSYQRGDPKLVKSDLF